MFYWKVLIEKIDERMQEELIASLHEFNPEGFEQTGDCLKVYFTNTHFQEESISRCLLQHQFNIEKLPHQNWNQLWESNFQPVQVHNFCGIRAEFHQRLINVRFELVITPKMSFGTGHHATTFMMIEQMEYMNFNDKSVLDFGTGTGILSILSEKLSAASVVAIDNDEWSIKNAHQNLQRNQCSRIKLYQRSTPSANSTYGILLVNINKHIILEQLSELTHCVLSNGLLLLSGLLLEDEQEIINACSSKKLTLLKKVVKNNWISLLFVNTGKA